MIRARGRSIVIAAVVALLAFPAGIVYAEAAPPAPAKPAETKAVAPQADAAKAADAPKAKKSRGKKKRSGKLAKGRRGKKGKLAKGKGRRGKSRKSAKAGGKGAKKGSPSAGIGQPARAVAATLRGNLALEQALVRKNGLPRLKTFAELRRAIARKRLVPLVLSPAVRLDPTFGEFASPDERKLLAYVHPEVNDCLAVHCGNLFRKFGQWCSISSAVRPMVYQLRVKARNFQAVGAFASSHPAGRTVDVRTAGMPPKALGYFDALLAAEKRRGRIYVAKEPGARHVLVVRRFRAS